MEEFDLPKNELRDNMLAFEKFICINHYNKYKNDSRMCEICKKKKITKL